MPTFEINDNGKTFEITAPDQAAAMSAFQRFKGGEPAKPDFAGEIARKMQNGQQSSNIEDRTKPPEMGLGEKLMASTGATVNGLVNSIPVLGPLAQGTTDVIGGGIAQITGGNFNDYIQRQQQLRQQTAQQAPMASLAGNLAGGIGAYGALTKIPGMATTLGFKAGQPGLKGLAGQTVNAGLSTQGIGMVDNMARGQMPGEAMTNATGPAAISALIPGVGKALGVAGKGAYEGIVKPVATAFNRDNEAIARTGRAITQDRSSGRVLGAAEEAAANTAGAPIYNADRFGSATRALARTALNVSPEAENALKGAVQDRFYTQGPRAVGFVRQLMNGATDDLALQGQLLSAAEKANSANYAKAWASPSAQAVWNQPIKELMQSDTFRTAINMAEKRGTDRAAVAGFKAVRNPFQFGADGSVSLKTNPDGSRALPSLQFWDQVKRNLDGMIGEAQRSGDKTRVADLMGLKTKLVASLDQAVPEYRQARGVAASFFGAEDAIDAGKKAFSSVRNTPEIAAAVAKMTAAERDAFSVGYSSELIDAINATGDRVNVINKLFGSTQSRQRIEIALGPQKARELEAYTRAEQILDELRVAVSGNSTTAKQLIAAGLIGGGAGLWASGGNPQTAFTWAALAAVGRRGAQMIGKKVDDQVMKKVSEMLVSQNPADVQRAIQNASMSQQHMDALRAIMQGLEISARGAVMGTAAAN